MTASGGREPAGEGFKRRVHVGAPSLDRSLSHSHSLSLVPSPSRSLSLVLSLSRSLSLSVPLYVLSVHDVLSESHRRQSITLDARQRLGFQRRDDRLRV